MFKEERQIYDAVTMSSRLRAEEAIRHAKRRKLNRKLKLRGFRKGCATGKCSWCEGNRKHASNVRMMEANEQVRHYLLYGLEEES